MDIKLVKNLYKNNKLKNFLDTEYQKNINNNLNKNSITYALNKKIKLSKRKLDTDEKLFGCLKIPECKNVIEKIKTDKEYKNIVFSTASKEYTSKIKNLLFLNNSNKEQIIFNHFNNANNFTTLEGNWLKTLKRNEILKEKNKYRKKQNTFVERLVKDYKENQIAYKQNVEKLRKSNQTNWRDSAINISRSLVIGTFITSYLCKNPEFDKIWSSVKNKLMKRNSARKKWWYKAFYNQDIIINKTFPTLSTISNILSDLNEIEEINNMYTTIGIRNENGVLLRNQTNLPKTLWKKEIKLYEKLKQQLLKNLHKLEELADRYVIKTTKNGITQRISGQYYSGHWREYFGNLLKPWNNVLHNKRAILPMLFLSLGFGLGAGSCIDNTIMTYVGMANHPDVTKEDFLKSQMKRNTTHFETQVRSEQYKLPNYFYRMTSDVKSLDEVFNLITIGSFYRHLKTYNTKNTQSYFYNEYKIPLLKEFLYKSFDLHTKNQQQAFIQYVFRI